MAHSERNQIPKLDKENAVSASRLSNSIDFTRLTSLVEIGPLLPMILQNNSKVSKSKYTKTYTEQEVQVIKKILFTNWAPKSYSAAQLFEEELANQRFFTTGHSSLDHLLEGGILSGEVTEFCAGTEDTITQIFHRICTKAIQSNTTPINCVYLHTSGDFSSAELLRHFDDPDQPGPLENVRVIFVSDVAGLLDVVHGMKKKIKTQSGSCGFYGNVKLIIIDNISQVLMSLSNANHTENAGLLALLGHELSYLAVSQGCSVLVSSSQPTASLSGSWCQYDHVGLAGTLPRPHTRLYIDNYSTETTKPTIETQDSDDPNETDKNSCQIIENAPSTRQVTVLSSGRLKPGTICFLVHQ